LNDAPSVSIIMPVYGVERYIAKSIESVLNQTFSQFELIIVDDCSPDKSADIVGQYATNDGRIKILRAPQNLGLGGARNLGLSAALGDYVLFVDSDDYIDRNAVAELYHSAQAHNAQVIVCGFYEVHCDAKGTVKEEVPVCPSNNIFMGSGEIHRQVARLDVSTLGRFAWNKLYQRQFLIAHDIVFEKKEPIEDICFNLKVYDGAESMVTIDKPLYFYFKRTNAKTLSTSYNDKLFGLFKERYTRIMEYHKRWELSDADIMQMNYNIHLRHIIVLIQRISTASEMNRQNKREKIRAILYDPSTRQCMHDMKCTSFYYAVFILLIRLKVVPLLLFLSKLVYSIKIVFPKYYGNLRAKG
jgi:glycosyltransferase involved in cell wall biosynthesis